MVTEEAVCGNWFGERSRRPAREEKWSDSIDDHFQSSKISEENASAGRASPFLHQDRLHEILLKRKYTTTESIVGECEIILKPQRYAGGNWQRQLENSFVGREENFVFSSFLWGAITERNGASNSSTSPVKVLPQHHRAATWKTSQVSKLNEFPSLLHLIGSLVPSHDLALSHDSRVISFAQIIEAQAPAPAKPPLGPASLALLTCVIIAFLPLLSGSAVVVEVEVADRATPMSFLGLYLKQKNIFRGAPEPYSDRQTVHGSHVSFCTQIDSDGWFTVTTLKFQNKSVWYKIM